VKSKGLRNQDITLYSFQGLQPGAFELWVGCISACTAPAVVPVDVVRVIAELALLRVRRAGARRALTPGGCQIRLVTRTMHAGWLSSTEPRFDYCRVVTPTPGGGLCCIRLVTWNIPAAINRCVAAKESKRMKNIT
jgi:hypothetical protein